MSDMKSGIVVAILGLLCVASTWIWTTKWVSAIFESFSHSDKHERPRGGGVDWFPISHRSKLGGVYDIQTQRAVSRRGILHLLEFDDIMLIVSPAYC